MISRGILLNLNSSCNLACSYCYQKNTSDYLQEASQTLIQGLQQLLANNPSITFIQVFGGEPILSRMLLLQLLDYSQKLNYQRPRNQQIHINIVTNGTIFFSELARYTDIVSLQISLDGGETAHNTYRVFADGTASYSAIIQNIQRYRDSQVPLQLHSVVKDVRRWSKSLPAMAKDIGDIRYTFNWDMTESNPIKDIWNVLITRVWIERVMRRAGIRFLTPYSSHKHTSLCFGGDTFLNINKNGEVFSCEVEFPEAKMGMFRDGRFEFTAKTDQDILAKQDLSRYKIHHLLWGSSYIIKRMTTYTICNFRNKSITGNQYRIPFRDVIRTAIAQSLPLR